MALVQTFQEVGSDAPTLCGNWSAKDLLIHLLLRENRPDAALGMFLPPAAGHLDKVTKQYLQHDFEDLLRQWRQGAKAWNPMRYADRFANVTEHFVHHEDVRRAQPDWQPRTLAPQQKKALERATTGIAKMLLRQSPVRVSLYTPDRLWQVSAGKGSDTPTVEVHGEIGELLLWLFGRDDHCKVTFEGSAEDLKKVKRAQM